MAKPVHIEGLKELENALRELPKATRANVARRILRKRAQPIADHAARVAPWGEGDLSKSYAVSTKLSKRQRREHRKAHRDDVEMFAGAGALAQAITQEFGTFKEDPQPSLRPAWDAEREGVLNGIGQDLWSEIRKAAARLARKTAKQAAKQAAKAKR